MKCATCVTRATSSRSCCPRAPRTRCWRLHARAERRANLDFSASELGRLVREQAARFPRMARRVLSRLRRNAAEECWPLRKSISIARAGRSARLPIRCRRGSSALAAPLRLLERRRGAPRASSCRRSRAAQDHAEPVRRVPGARAGGGVRARRAGCSCSKRCATHGAGARAARERRAFLPAVQQGSLGPRLRHRSHGACARIRRRLLRDRANPAARRAAG